MSAPPYQYDRRNSTRYTFISKGRFGAVVKVVEFTPTSVKSIINLGFGDLLADGNVDDKANTNNNDIVKVIATVIEIVKDFISEFPDSKIVFTGSNAVRTAMYHRILRTYYKDFSVGFVITALEKEGSIYLEKPFDPTTENKYLAFFVKGKL